MNESYEIEFTNIVTTLAFAPLDPNRNKLKRIAIKIRMISPIVLTLYILANFSLISVFLTDGWPGCRTSTTICLRHNNLLVINLRVRIVAVPSVWKQDFMSKLFEVRSNTETLRAPFHYFVNAQNSHFIVINNNSIQIYQ